EQQRPVPVPRQLPAPPTPFTGRARELAALSRAAESLAILTIGGTGGIGKSWLALHWAHRHIAPFPDGQLFVNLRGFDPSGHPTSPQTALRGFLGALGVAPSDIPAEWDAQIGLYRSLLAGRRMIIIVDNAAEAAQVAPLLPGTPSC